MGSIVEAALYDIVGKFFLLFVIVPAGVIFLGYVIYMIAKILQELRKKENHICGEPASQPGRRLFLKRFTGGEGTPPRWCLPPSCSPRTRYRRGV